MASLFKMNPKTPLMKALVGKQKNLPEHLKQAILDAPAKSYGKSPMKKTDPKKGRTLADMKKGQYGTIRPMTDQEAAAYAAKTGTTRLGVRKQEKKYMSKTKSFQSGMTDVQKSRARMESTQGGSQMGKIIGAGGKGGEKGIAKEAKRRSAGKSPAKMKGVKGLKK
jgi:hypothetical protein